MKREDALDYHASGRPGKIAVVPTKPLNNQRDLALAYSPGVAIPCLEIAARGDDVYKYTAKGNLVAVVTNGTAVLGLVNIGSLAAKPVMEGIQMTSSSSASSWSRPSAESISKTSALPTVSI